MHKACSGIHFADSHHTTTIHIVSSEKFANRIIHQEERQSDDSHAIGMAPFPSNSPIHF
jgi:hypothetical protein